MTAQIIRSGGDSGLPQDGVEIRQHLRRIPLLEPNEFASDLAVAVDHISFRIHRSAIGLGDGRMIVSSERITIGLEDYALFAEEFFISRRILVGGNPQNDAAPRLDVLLQSAL